MAKAASVEVKTGYGAVRGTEIGGVRTFRGIPFAAPPVGALRFAAPERPAPWEGVLDATTSGAACVQPTGLMPGQEEAIFSTLFGPGKLPMSEDCLYLNVFAPAGAEHKPVMVWIHGGAFIIGTGSSPMYDGSSLAKRGDVVVVTINYRLGVLGFLNVAEAGPCNAGLLDQVAALTWVRDEIAAFGGDPGNVTIFGESAGGKSVECLSAMPAARGLFRRAIVQSTYDPPMELDAAVAAASKLLVEVGVADAAGGAIDLVRLRTVPVEDLLGAQTRQTREAMASGGGIGSGLGSWIPVVDGDTLPRLPRDAFAAGDAAGITMAIGTTRDEAKLFTAMMPMLAALQEPALPTMLGMLVGSSETAEALIAAYRGSRGADFPPVDLFVAAMTDRMFRQHSLHLAEAQSKQQPETWMYLFEWEGVGMDGTIGACHALELPFVFGTLDSELGQLAGSGAEAAALSTAMQDAWSAFARTGDPSSAALAWPRYDTSRKATAVFGRKLELRDAPLEAERQAWVALGLA